MPYSEPELVLPALEAMIRKRRLAEIGATVLIATLRERLKPSGADLKILMDRNDDQFSQKVRNLASHDTLRKKGLADVRREGRQSFFRITAQGVAYHKTNAADFNAVLEQGFSDGQRRHAAEVDFKDIVIEEGALKDRSGKAYERSRTLTTHARQRFADGAGRILCRGCGFEGEAKYGEDGLGLIDIHHTQPLYLGGGESETKDLERALKLVAPLCPNCHRLVHRVRSRLMSMAELRKRTGYTAG